MHQIGSLVSPTLKEISKISYPKYSFYLTLLCLDVDTFFKYFPAVQNVVAEDDRNALNIFEYMILSNECIQYMEDMFNFFFVETVVFSRENECFLVIDNDIIGNSDDDRIHVVGFINKDNYDLVVNLICQKNYISFNKQEEDLSKIKSKKAREIMEKLIKGRKEKAKNNKTDKNMELGNVISAVASRHNSLNLNNIWDLTVYQLWDTFFRLINNNMYDIGATSVAVYGNKDNHFEANAWYQKMNNEN